METLQECYRAVMRLRFLCRRGALSLDEFFIELEPIVDRARYIQGARSEVNEDGDGSSG